MTMCGSRNLCVSGAVLGKAVAGGAGLVEDVVEAGAGWDTDCHG